MSNSLKRQRWTDSAGINARMVTEDRRDEREKGRMRG